MSFNSFSCVHRLVIGVYNGWDVMTSFVIRKWLIFFHSDDKFVFTVIYPTLCICVFHCCCLSFFQTYIIMLLLCFCRTIKESKNRKNRMWKLPFQFPVMMKDNMIKCQGHSVTIDAVRLIVCIYLLGLSSQTHFCLNFV